MKTSSMEETPIFKKKFLENLPIILGSYIYIYEKIYYN